MNTKKSKKRKALTVLNALLAVILALMLGATALAHSLMNKMNRVENPEAPVFEKVLTSTYRPYDTPGAAKK